MVEPYTKEEQVAKELFIPDRRLVIAIATSRYHKAHKRVDDKIMQGVTDLSECRKDIEIVCSTLKRYNIKDMGRKDIYKLDKDPSWAEVIVARKDLSSRVKNSPDLKFLLIFVVAGHGIMRDGRQTILVNEFDKSTSFYKAWCIEAEIRTRAYDFPNTF